MALDNFRKEHPKCVFCGKLLRIAVSLEHDEGGWRVETEWFPVLEDALKVVVETHRGIAADENWAHRRCLEKALPHIELPGR